MRTVALSRLRERVRWRADEEGATDRFPDAELDDCINEGIAAFHTELIRADGQGVAEGEYVFQTENGTADYSVPAEFLQLISVKIDWDGSSPQIMHTYQEFDADILDPPDAWNGFGPAFYRIKGDNIRIKPTPQNAKTITIQYISTAVRLVDPSNTLDGINGLEEYVVAWAAQCLAVKNRDWELDDRLEKRMGQALDKLYALISNRNSAEPERIIDAEHKTRSSWNDRYRGLGWGRR